MAGTDKRKQDIVLPDSDDAPAVILVEPQMGENIGFAARAMWNFGLHDLRIVNPRDGWPNEKAEAASSGALAVIQQAKLYDNTRDAVADLGFIMATTARERGQKKSVMTPNHAALEMRALAQKGPKAGLLFGPERSGLNNDDIALCDALIRIPTNPAYASLNLAQAVLLIGYEWFQAGAAARGDEEITVSARIAEDNLARKESVTRLFDHMQDMLEKSGFLHPPEKTPEMMRNLQNMFHRMGMTEQDVSTFRGVIRYLSEMDPDKL